MRRHRCDGVSGSGGSDDGRGTFGESNPERCHGRPSGPDPHPLRDVRASGLWSLPVGNSHRSGGHRLDSRRRRWSGRPGTKATGGSTDRLCAVTGVDGCGEGPGTSTVTSSVEGPVVRRLSTQVVLHPHGTVPQKGTVDPPPADVRPEPPPRETVESRVEGQ